ncbi:branched-chain amino acid ABC transporter permease [Lachnospiraceae bacterium ASD3451]|uniref:Branched-chain amino acid ABC transporter permease n=2 Tax=Diplocloster agilis TaxID=2850323 RepID=A0A949JZQ8_9FIRM|nr:branched-chain amino acid ABC transporter permease [Diplocloster agilis]MBU9738200.1 branched-chain amino acid ABC transporter permease [Diplocloster agilis]MBU9743695.1 branched-chain amino acid ABC transporter permease [Diplocloster agilis]
MKSGMLNRQYTALIVPVGVNIMLAVSLNLVTGFLGELSLGHACFMSIGAYTGALISTSMELPSYAEFFLALIAGGVMAAVFGFLIGVPVLRLHGDYLAIVTLAFGEIVKSVLNALPFTNGSKGLSKIPMYSNYQHYTLVFILVILTIVIITNLVKSRHGRAICSLRDNYIASESIGIPVSRFKVLAFVIGAFFAGIAGVVYAHNVGIIKPTTFDYNKSIEILVIVVLGGMGSIKGSIIAAVILTVLPEMLRGADDYRMLLYSIVLIVMMLFNNSEVKERLLEMNLFKRHQKEVD